MTTRRRAATHSSLRSAPRRWHRPGRWWSAALCLGAALPLLRSDEPAERDAPRRVYRVPVEGIIDLGLAPFVARVVAEAEANAPAAVLLDINTFGGRVDAAVMIRDSLLAAEVPTVAFVDPRAISAGALIALACETIAVAPGSSIGAATVVTGAGSGEVQAADEKAQSYMRSEFRATAERRGRRGDVAEAMVDADVAIDDVVAEGKLLTLTDTEALELGMAELGAEDVDAVLAALGYEGAALVERGPNWAEQLARGISHPVLSSLLLSLGFLGLLVELYQPGWGIPGTLGIACLVVFFFGHTVVQLAGLEEVLLFVAGVALLALELLVIPGFGIAGIAGIVAILVAVFLSLIGLDFRVSWNLGLVGDALGVLSGAIVGVAVGGVVLYRVLPRARSLRFLVLEGGLAKDAGYVSHERETEGRFPIGTEAKALSDLRPAGRVRVDGVRLQAVSEGGWIQSGTRVRIVAWRAGTPVVREAPAEVPDAGEPAAEVPDAGDDDPAKE